MVLDSVVPQDMVLPVYFARDSQRAFEKLTAACAADPGCAQAFPNLADRFEQMLARLDRKPERVTVTHPRTGKPEPVTLDRLTVSAVVFSALYLPETSAMLPFLIHRATEGDYSGLLARLRDRALPMICANPDVVVERGHSLVYCAGAIADLYASLGGEVIYAGKPHRPIYDEALAIAAAARGRATARDRVLAIGDSLRTDLEGAAAIGVDFLFVTAGIHAEELGGRDNPDAAALERILAAVGVSPKAVMHRLAW